MAKAHAASHPHHGTYLITPCRSATATASAMFLTPSLTMMFLRCVLTVDVERYNLSAVD